MTTQKWDRTLKSRSLKILAQFSITGVLIASLIGCQTINRKMEPTIIYSPPVHHIRELPSAFEPLSREEYCQEWSKELRLGDAFARELDLYRALTCYKSASILLPEENIERRLQIDYNIILCYYLGHKYQDAINIFEDSFLAQINAVFPAFNNLLVMLFDCYQETGQTDKVDSVFEMIERCSPETAEDLALYYDLKEGNLGRAEDRIACHPLRDEFTPSLASYHQFAKSPTKARRLNAILPGAGYYYVGQKRSAITSFIINSLFIAAAYQFFQRGYVAAGIITTSLETGWYLGGINGAGIEAEEFNTRLYEGSAINLLIHNKLFPVLTFETAF